VAANAGDGGELVDSKADESWEISIRTWDSHTSRCILPDWIRRSFCTGIQPVFICKHS